MPVPVVMLIHGGYWSADFHLNLATAFAVELARRGVAAWNVEYRRVGAGGGWARRARTSLPRSPRPRRAAGASPIPLDLGNVRIVGHSAGAQLALWVAGQRDSLVRPERVVSQAGALDLASRSATRRGGVVLEDLFGVDHASDPQIYLDASPLHRVPTGIPTVCLHGAEDLRIPASGSRVYVERAVAAGDRAVLWEVPGEGHNDFLDRGSRSWELSLRAALDPAPWSVGGEA